MGIKKILSTHQVPGMNWKIKGIREMTNSAVWRVEEIKFLEEGKVQRKLKLKDKTE